MFVGGAGVSIARGRYWRGTALSRRAPGNARRMASSLAGSRAGQPAVRAPSSDGSSNEFGCFAVDSFIVAPGPLMSTPVTAAEFLDYIRKSGVVEPNDLDVSLTELRAKSELPEEAKELAKALIQQGLLTHF